MAAASNLHRLSVQKRRKVLAEFFQRHRERAGLDHSQVAEALDLESADSVRAYEAGEVELPLEDIFTLTNLFNIPPDDVVALILEASSRQEQT